VKYACPPDLGVVTCYYNPCGFLARAENFERFVEPIRSGGIPLVVVEACFDCGTFTLPEQHGALRVSARDLMWQKERLLDLGAGHLPGRCSKVAWLDADVIFERDDWAVETARLLDDLAVVQPFASAVRLSRGATEPRPGDDSYEGFGFVYTTRPEALAHGKYDLHGHTGFAWAAQRDLLGRHGLYDASIGGSGDHMMAHAFAADDESPCITRMVGRGRHRAHFRRWSRRIQPEVRGRLGYLPGRLLHLWHGTIENRRYMQRNRELKELGFDPFADIGIADNGVWRWTSDKPALHAWAERYYAERREDEDG
jgi:hypothetical protein